MQRGPAAAHSSLCRRSLHRRADGGPRSHAARQIDVQQHAYLCSTLYALVQRIGINRRARDVVPDLKDYLDAKAELSARGGRRMKRRVTILDAIADKQFVRPLVPRSLHLDRLARVPRRAVRAADDRRATRDLSAMHRPQPRRRASPHAEAWLVCGRRAGKSFVLALIAVFLACFHDWRQHLAPGERGTVMIVAADRKQARVILRYIRGLLTGRADAGAADRARDGGGVRSEQLGLHRSRHRVVSHRARLHHRRRAARRAGVLADNGRRRQSRLRGDKRHPPRHGDHSRRDAAVRLIAVCSPRRAVGRASPALRQGRRPDPGVAGADARDEPDRASARDRRGGRARPGRCARPSSVPSSGATSRASSASRRCRPASSLPGVLERPSMRGTFYHGFVDPSGGSADSMTLCIGHHDLSRETVVIDALREVKPPFSPEIVVEEFSKLLKAYGVTQHRRRSLCRRVAARAVRQVRHHLRGVGRAQDRSLSRPAGSAEQRAGRPARPPEAHQPAGGT